MKINIIVISKTSLTKAQKLQMELSDCVISTRYNERNNSSKGVAVKESFSEVNSNQRESLAEFIKKQRADFDAFIFFSAMGICVRAIQPIIDDKHTDPAVVCVDAGGRFAISVLSGHVGRANELTKTVASILGAQPVITTQSDNAGLWALDMLGGKFGWTAVPGCGCRMNDVIAAFVSRKPTALVIDIRDRGTEELESTKPSFVDIVDYETVRDSDKYQLIIAVTPFIRSWREGVMVLQYVPRVLSAGIGLAHQAKPVEDIIAQITSTWRSNGIFAEAIGCIATADIKDDEPVIRELGKRYPVRLFTAEQLDKVEVPTPSEVVKGHVGTKSVSEAAALLASENGALVLAKQKGGDYTTAVAVGRNALRQGHIEIVGAGPGDPDLVSVRGRRMLEHADLILYAGSLVPRALTDCAKQGAVVRSSASLNLEEQFALMKTFYDQGKFVVRLHTGDPCIYGAIEEQMNFFDRHGMDYHITPGISSFQAAAAELKSQFTIPEKVQTIILTRGEGRTPMPKLEKLHLLARSQSTMCIFLSAAIAEEVQGELLQTYPPETPVAVCYHLTWKDQRIYRGELQHLADIVSDNQLTLTTMIVIGEAIGNRAGTSKLYDKDFKHLFRK